MQIYKETFWKVEENYFYVLLSWRILHSIKVQKYTQILSSIEYSWIVEMEIKSLGQLLSRFEEHRLQISTDVGVMPYIMLKQVVWKRSRIFNSREDCCFASPNSVPYLLSLFFKVPLFFS